MYIVGAETAKIGRVRFWAERGLIHWEDAKDNSYGTQTVASFLHKINAFSEMMGNSLRKSKDREWLGDDNLAQQIRNFIDDGAAIAKQAQVQGMPSDPSAVRDLARRRPASVVMPSSLASF